MTSFDSTIIWLNENTGVITLVIFLVTLLLGWLSGIFTALQNKPRLRIDVVLGDNFLEYEDITAPSFYSMVETGSTFGNKICHRTCLALYLNIGNIGGPTTIDAIKVYFRSKSNFGLDVGELQAVNTVDFTVDIGDWQKLYPKLIGQSSMTTQSTDLYLQKGAVVKGVEYFEGDQCYESFHPIGIREPNKQKSYAKFKVVIFDTYGRKYSKRFKIPFATLTEALKFNTEFGTSKSREDLYKSSQNQEGLDQLRELSVDTHGNLLIPVSFNADCER